MPNHIPFIGRTHDSSTWTARDDDFIDFISSQFNDESVTPAGWSGRNSVGARRDGATLIIERYILPYLEENPGSPIRLVGFSHGGNVAIRIVNELAQMGIEVDTLITIGTPVRGDNQLASGVSPGQFINVYNQSDRVQVNLGGRWWHAGQAWDRHFPTADENVDAQSRRGHGDMHNRTIVWTRYIMPAVGRN